MTKIDKEILVESLVLDTDWNIKAVGTLLNYIKSTTDSAPSPLYIDERFLQSFKTFFIDTKAQSSNQIHTLVGTVTMTEMKEILQLYLDICADEETVETLLEYNGDIQKYLKKSGVEKRNYKHVRYFKNKGFTLFRRPLDDQELSLSIYF